jgi:molybdopterin-guanine dinucleotide biosynthesis protein A
VIDDCLAVIMAGGDSQRMGRDKASLVLGEQTLMQRVAEIMQVVFPQVVVSVRTPRADIALPQVCDVFSDLGPLAGLCAGLDYASQDGVPWIFAVATDMPFLRPALIEQLANYRSGVDAVVPLVDGHPQPLAAFYSIDALPAVRALATGEGKRSLRAALERLQVAYVHAADLITADPGLDSFVDLDTPEDLAKAIDQKEG